MSVLRRDLWVYLTEHYAAEKQPPQVSIVLLKWNISIDLPIGYWLTETLIKVNFTGAIHFFS